jgi:hypothetical protein
VVHHGSRKEKFVPKLLYARALRVPKKNGKSASLQEAATLRQTGKDALR